MQPVSIRGEDLEDGADWHFPDGIKQVARSRDILVLSGDGRIFGWGANEYGRLGLGDAEARGHPTPQAAPFTAVQIAIADYHAAAVADRALRG